MALKTRGRAAVIAVELGSLFQYLNQLNLDVSQLLNTLDLVH